MLNTEKEIKSTQSEAAAVAPSAPAVPAGPTEVSETDKSSKANVNDDDLDDLDDLLDDFADDVLNKPPGSGIEGGTVVDEKEASLDPTNPINNEISQANIEDLLKDLKIEDPETKKQFEELVKQFDDTQKKEAQAGPQNFDDVMKDTMDRLKKSGKNIDEQIKNDQSASNPEDVLTQLLAGMGGAGGEGGDLDMSKLLVDMLEQLSSKEVLYEPIKDLNTKFPEYLEENKGKISQQDYDNYTKQYDITVEIIAIFEAPGYTDEDKAKRDQVNTLLESLQDLGQPPKELVGEAGEIPGLGAGAGPGGAGGLGGLGGLNFNDKDLPQDFEKQLEEGCNQT